MCGLLLGLAAAILAIFSNEAMSAAVQSAALFARGVMPALFPMLVLSALAPNGAGRSWLATVLFALLAGSPAAAQRVRGLYDCDWGNSTNKYAYVGTQDNAQDNAQDKAQNNVHDNVQNIPRDNLHNSTQNNIVDNARLTALLGATGVMSPMFFIGTLAAWTGRSDAAWLMLIAHWTGAMLSGLCGFIAHRSARMLKQWVNKQTRLIARYTKSGIISNPTNANTGAFKPTRISSASAISQNRIRAEQYIPASPACVSASSARVPLSSALPNALKSSAQSLLAVCAAMMLFSIAAALIRATLESLLPELVASSPRLLAAVWAMLEIGGGSSELIRLGANLPLVCAMCGFGGLSMCIQNLLFIGDIVSPARLLCLRALHAALSYVICATLL